MHPALESPHQLRGDFETSEAPLSYQLWLGQDAEPHTAPDVLVSILHGSQRHQCINVL